MADEIYQYDSRITVNYSDGESDFRAKCYQQARLHYYEGKRLSPFVCPDDIPYRHAQRIGQQIFAEVKRQYDADQLKKQYQLNFREYLKQFWRKITGTEETADV